MSPDTPAGSTSQSGQAGAAFCFRVKQERPGWNILHPVATKRTVDLAALVCSAPEFLGMDGGDALCQVAVVLSERGEARVVAAVDEVGGITLVGCPGQLSRDALTTVVQELLVFMGKLWRMPREEFSSVLEKRLGQSLADYFSSRIPIGWSENGFRAGLGRSLERGRFPVVLLLSDASAEVAEAAAHLKSHNIEVKQLGVELYESSGVEIIMPRALGVTEPGPREERGPVRQTPRPTPSQPKAPPRPQPTAPGPTGAEQTQRESAAPVNDLSRPAESAAPAVEDQPSFPAEAAEPTTVAAETPTEPVPAKKMPWSDQPAPVISDIVPPLPQSKPAVVIPPPAPKPQASRPAWDGTMPGVMSGRRPPRRSPEGQGTRKGHDQPGRNER